MKEEEDYRREDIEWLKKQIEKMDSEENLEENSTRQILDDELNEFFMKLSIFYQNRSNEKLDLPC